jgi:hypothetical protein
MAFELTTLDKDTSRLGWLENNTMPSGRKESRCSSGSFRQTNGLDNRIEHSSSFGRQADKRRQKRRTIDQPAYERVRSSAQAEYSSPLSGISPQVRGRKIGSFECLMNRVGGQQAALYREVDPFAGDGFIDPSCVADKQNAFATNAPRQEVERIG